MSVPEKTVSARASALLSAAALAGFLLVFQEAADFGAGARVFPRVLGLVGALSAAVVLIQSCLQVLAERRRADGLGSGAHRLNWRDVVISYIGPPIYALLVYFVGFWIASALSLAGLLALLGERRAWLVLALVAGTLGAIYVMFELSFDVRMPRGLLLG
jgi:hypothetical protein